MKILIYGFGRMGLTHFSILNSLNADVNFSVIEPNSILRAIVRKNIRAKFFKNDSNLNKPYDITLITTPPSIHLHLLNSCIKRGDKRIFVEKPFGGYTNVNIGNIPNFKNINIGYVLRFNPCIQWVKKNINPKNIKSLNAQYLSNTIAKKPEGWRNGPYSGVLNEMGSHIIDLIYYIIGKDDEMKVVESRVQSKISDIDDIVETTLLTKNSIEVSLYFNWIKKDIRKPIFRIHLLMKDGTKYIIDQQQINKLDKKDLLIEKVSVTDLIKSVPYYLRGIDFTSQMMDLIGNQKIIAKMDEALKVNSIMKKILKK